MSAMSTRRNFLKSIIAAVALSPVLCRFKGDEMPSPEGYRINPEYENAQCEMTFFAHPGMFQNFTDMETVSGGAWMRIV